VPRFRRFLGGTTGRFLRAEEGRNAGQALSYSSRLGLRKLLKRGHCLVPFRPPIANLKNASFEGREKKKENEEKIMKNKKIKVRNNFVA
jgi:hypothetical protein